MTHTLAGATIGRAFFARSLGPAAVPVLAVASNLTDVDAVVHLLGLEGAITWRRTFGHSLLLLPAWSWTLAWLFGRANPALGWRRLWGPCAAGMAGHLLLDLVNSFGVLLLWPLRPWRPELAWVFIIDLVLTAILAAPHLLGLLPRLRGKTTGLCRLGAGAAAGYLLVCGGSRALASAALERAEPSAEWRYVFPEPLGPHRWRGVARGGGGYRLYLMKPYSGEILEARRERDESPHPAAQAARRTRLGSRLTDFFKAPVWRVKELGGGAFEASVFDLRFNSLVIPRGTPFLYRFHVAPDGLARPL